MLYGSFKTGSAGAFRERESTDAIYNLQNVYSHLKINYYQTVEVLNENNCPRPVQDAMGAHQENQDILIENRERILHSWPR